MKILKFLLEPIMNQDGFLAELIGGGLSLLGGWLGGKEQEEGLEKSAEATKSAADKSAQVTWDMFASTSRQMKPFRQAGYKMLPALQKQALSNKASPLYRWMLKEGERNINRSLASRGLYGSGAGLETLSRFYEETAANEYMRKYGMRYDLAKLGAGAAESTGSAAMQAGGNLANIYGTEGTNLANIYQAQGAGKASMYSGLGAMPLNIYSTYQNVTQQQQLLDILKKSMV